MKVTITQGLSELKLLDKRINSAIQAGGFVSYYRPGQTLQGSAMTAEEIKKKAKSSYQSVLDLIARRDKIKAAIVVSNALTTVTIVGETLTVAAAIEKKSSVEYFKTLIMKLQIELKQAIKEEKLRLDKVEEDIKTLLTSAVVANEADRATLIDNYRKNNLGSISGVTYEEIEELVSKSEQFVRTVDTVLTISNSTTAIEID